MTHNYAGRALYPHDNPSLALAAVPADRMAVLVRPYHRGEAAHRGVVVARRVDGELVVADLMEKPSRERARELEDEHDASNLWLLEGRARLTRRFVDHLRRAPMSPGTEPKLSLAIRRHAMTEPVHLVVTHSTVTDLGSLAGRSAAAAMAAR
jgi:UTP-glucose-1-phosphate uridylyltransferase